MTKYIRFSIYCTSKSKNLRDFHREIIDVLKGYALDERMILFSIPIDAEEYQYAHNLALKYSWDYDSDLEMEDKPGVYINESEIVETKYLREDYEKAKAYLVNFWYFVYTYESIPIHESLGDCCDSPSWKYVTGFKQNTHYRIPPSEFKNKKYAKLLPGYAVSEEIVDLLVDNGFATRDDFLEVFNKKRDKVVAYQIMPKHEITGFAEDNNMELVDICACCGLKRYQDVEEPYYISKDTLEKMEGLNVTTEVTGPVIEERHKLNPEPEEICSYVEPWIIVDKKVYELLHEHYPRMQFIPVFEK